eukprot:CAMPEP_0197031716 /NCGR_PEP_ID=MMETSP1384-20130603/10636_1 /TAXON_ID=29189 /ORGANISM="Ammonia sp." /LENGTH=180 /DNA_ID=CAMNT_0042461283 /DNA_START=277 /DNA_END=819 /DNA_ORIENTATION=+
MAAGILSAFALIEVKKRQPKGSDLIGPLMHWHKSIGVLCGGLVIARLGLRFTTKIPAMVEGPAAMHNAAKLSHLGLYSAMIFFPTTGVLMGYYGGKGIPFFWTKIEGAKEGNKTIAKNSWKLHKKLGVFFEALVALHACGAVAHLMMGQNIFGRISPFSGAALFSLADEDDEDDDDDLLS